MKAQTVIKRAFSMEGALWFALILLALAGAEAVGIGPTAIQNRVRAWRAGQR